MIVNIVRIGVPHRNDMREFREKAQDRGIESVRRLTEGATDAPELPNEIFGGVTAPDENTRQMAQAFKSKIVAL